MKRVYSREELVVQRDAAYAERNRAVVLFEEVKRERDALQREVVSLQKLVKELRAQRNSAVASLQARDPDIRGAV